jgi:hypothetical protein
MEVLPPEKERSKIVWASLTLPNSSTERINTAGDEFFALVNLPDSQSADIIAEITLSHVMWAYKLVGTRKYYWQDMLMFLSRIYRSTNMMLWQKRREIEFTSMPVQLALALCGDLNIRIGLTGNIRGFVLSAGSVTEIKKSDSDKVQYIGIERYGIKPNIQSIKIKKRESILITSGDFTDLLDFSIIQNSQLGNNDFYETPQKILDSIFAKVILNGKCRPVSAILIMRI